MKNVQRYLPLLWTPNKNNIVVISPFGTIATVISEDNNGASVLRFVLKVSEPMKDIQITYRSVISVFQQKERGTNPYGICFWLNARDKNLIRHIIRTAVRSPWRNGTGTDLPVHIRRMHQEIPDNPGNRLRRNLCCTGNIADQNTLYRDIGDSAWCVLRYSLGDTPNTFLKAREKWSWFS